MKNSKIQDELVVPIPVRKLLTQLKHQLRDAMIDTINTDYNDKPEILVQHVIGQFQLQGISIDQCEGPPSNNLLGSKPSMGNCEYGVIEDISLKQINGHKNLLAMTTTLGIPCGADSSLYLLQKKKSGWELIFVSESNEYEDISGAYGDFGYSISPISQP